MMKAKKVNIAYTIGCIVLGSLVISVVILQIVYTGSASTKLESALFSILQFVFSLAFAYILARASMKSEFAESQKRFAIAAYRSINEIDRGVQRLLSRCTDCEQIDAREAHPDIAVIASIATEISDSIQSSVADWGDIIGDEIATLREIEQLRRTQETSPYSLAATGSLRNTHSDEVTDVPERVHLQAKIEQLLSMLPGSLRAIAADESERQLNRDLDILNRIRQENGFVELDGFSIPSVENHISNLAIGDQLTVRTGDHGTRVGALMTYDDQARLVGVVMNLLVLDSTYSEFEHAIFRHVGASAFHVEVSAIDEDVHNDRQYFQVKIVGSFEQSVDSD